MKSEAMLLSLEWRFSRGRFLTPALLGYDRVEVPDGNGSHKKVLVVNADEALTVKLMYYMLLNGSSLTEIAETLNDLGRETGLRKVCGKRNTRWTRSTVSEVLRNERYCGDVLARKTWTPDFHDHKSKRNNGKKNKYYQPGHHEAIVTRAQWNAAQRILNSRRYRFSGSYLQMRVIDHGALTGFISINKSWAGCDADELYRLSSIAMGLESGEMETDLGSEHLPEGGFRLARMAEDNGVQRIARTLSSAEEKMKAQLEGREAESTVEKVLPQVKQGFQVVSGSMFHHAFEATVTFWPNAMKFATACLSRLPGQQCVEALLNPVERMLVVRPCAADHPNALRWVGKDGYGNQLSAKCFCSILYGILGWDSGYAYSVPAVIRRRGNETVLFFDLDNYIGRELGRKQAPEAPTQMPESRIESDDTRGIFFGADDDEPQPIEDTEEIERRMQAFAEYEKRNFGTPAFEHNSEFRLTAIDDGGEWDVMAEARVLGEDHRVKQSEIDALHSAMGGGSQ